MTRSVAESSKNFSVFWLKKHGYLDKGITYKHGGITWTWHWSGHQNNLSFCVKKEESEQWIRLIYTVTTSEGEKTDMDYKIPLTTTKCNYGGVRYWFVCPLYKNGIYCGRRVGVVYNVSKWFGCRYCADVAYQAQFESGLYRISITEPDVKKAYDDVKRKFYKGKLTRKYKRFLRLDAKLGRAWMILASQYGIKF